MKLEVIGDEQTLFPDNEGLLEATRVLVKEGFHVLAYTNDDLVMALRLEAGARGGDLARRPRYVWSVTVDAFERPEVLAKDLPGR